MKHLLLSVLLSAMSIFAPSLQAQGSAIDATETGAPSADVDTKTEKPDINQIIASSTEFTNHVGMRMKKAGSLWISAFEITQKEYQEIMGSNPSAFPGDKRPVDSVNWSQAVSFCEKLTVHEKDKDMLPEGYKYGLPTQGQWEGLAQGLSLQDAVTSSNGSRSGTAEVGSLSPSGAGLYDLRGNVTEWCADPATGAWRALRGGSWADWIEINLRSAFVMQVSPTDAQNTYGFRCVLIEE